MGSVYGITLSRLGKKSKSYNRMNTYEVYVIPLTKLQGAANQSRVFKVRVI